jgi:hypothetical protein
MRTPREREPERDQEPERRAHPVLRTVEQTRYQNASMPARRQHSAAPEMIGRLESAPARSAATRLLGPGASTDSPRRMPAAPASRIAVSSNAPCPITNEKNGSPEPIFAM